ncbi:MAG TPA: UDP-N-acetylmuramate dehydrogenase [Acidimicrobiales bacterium]|nr:UDP-N-acetylmuramate dehydrogenase [Acidimicrobiales bacterium]
MTAPPAAAAVAAAAAVLGERARRDRPLGPLTTYRVGGPAALAVDARHEGDLEAVARAVAASGLPVLVVGRGSNLLVADAGFSGIAVTLGEGFATLDVEGLTVRAGGAVTLPVLARRTAAAGLTGLEWAVGVPGSVGGGVRMNAGGHGSDISRTLVSARVFDLGAGRPGERPAAGLELGYRRSALGPTDVVVAATFSLEAGERAAAEAEVAEVVRWRREHQPGGPNAGSVFTNPPGDAAGRLIEAAGLKGFRVGSAAVSTKHANFIQVDAGGRADDVRTLMVVVQERVFEQAGVRLHPEVHLVGFPQPQPSTGA